MQNLNLNIFHYHYTICRSSLRKNLHNLWTFWSTTVYDPSISTVHCAWPLTSQLSHSAAVNVKCWNNYPTNCTVSIINTFYKVNTKLPRNLKEYQQIIWRHQQKNLEHFIFQWWRSEVAWSLLIMKSKQVMKSIDIIFDCWHKQCRWIINV